MAEEQQEPTAEALKQRRKRKKAAAKDAALGVEKFTNEGDFKVSNLCSHELAIALALA